MKRFLQKLWDHLFAADPLSAERIVLYPRDSASAETLFQEISSPSLFSSTRLVIAHVSRPVHRAVRLESLARQISAIPEQTTLVLAVEGMSPLADETEALSTAAVSAADGRPRSGMNVAVWRPYNRPQLLEVAREILGAAGVRADEMTLNFWVDRIGANLERLQSEARRLKLLFADGEATQERLEEIFEVPHVHDETIWNALRALLSGEPSTAAPALSVLLQSSDVTFAAAELSRTMLCAQALSNAGPVGSPSNEIFLRFDVRSKRRQEKMIELASRISNSGRPIPHLAGRLLALDLALKQAKTAAGRQEVLLRSLLALCGEPEPAG